ncbi:VOC family protein [Paenibacillus medicaginis]|uniref:VOC family protein n=1 Tax=Paenibacillus medicaginis TaxID=1470560 RepID=A0ABV5C3P5_9BACL
MTNYNNHAGVSGGYTQNGTPNGYTAITPFIVVNNPAEAITFYETVFGTKMKSATEMDDNGNKIIVHADIDFGNGFLQLGAANPAYRLVLPPGDGNACYSLGIYVPDVDQTFALAIANGATVREPVANFVSGDRYCSILDPFGIRWSIMTRIEDISGEESYRRVAEWSKSL